MCVCAIEETGRRRVTTEGGGVAKVKRDGHLHTFAGIDRDVDVLLESQEWSCSNVVWQGLAGRP